MSHQCNAYCIPDQDIHCSQVYICPTTLGEDMTFLAQDIIAMAPASEAPSWSEYLRQTYRLPVAPAIVGDPEAYLMYWRKETCASEQPTIATHPDAAGLPVCGAEEARRSGIS